MSPVVDNFGAGATARDKAQPGGIGGCGLPQRILVVGRICAAGYILRGRFGQKEGF